MTQNTSFDVFWAFYPILPLPILRTVAICLVVASSCGGNHIEYLLRKVVSRDIMYENQTKTYPSVVDSSSSRLVVVILLLGGCGGRRCLS